MVRTAAGGRYRLATSLDNLFNEVNAAYPKRDRKTDGWLGDPAHQARVSQHNPDDKGIVRAIDVDKDGIDVKALLKAAIGHPAVWYVIHNGVIWSRTHGWKPRRYIGANAHEGHVHISIVGTDAAAKWAGRWLGGTPPRTKVAALRRGSSGARVRSLQKSLGVKVDGEFGPKTEVAVNRYKHRHGWPQDGVAGSRVLAALKAGK
jgi:hypothetical protein